MIAYCGKNTNKICFIGNGTIEILLRNFYRYQSHLIEGSYIKLDIKELITFCENNSVSIIRVFINNYPMNLDFSFGFR